MAAKISDTKLFYIQALVIVAVVCLPGNIFTAVMLYIQHFSSSPSTAANSTTATNAAANDTPTDAPQLTSVATSLADSKAELVSAFTSTMASSESASVVSSSASVSESTENVVFDATSASELFSENSSRNFLQVIDHHGNETMPTATATPTMRGEQVFKNGEFSKDYFDFFIMINSLIACTSSFMISIINFCSNLSLPSGLSS